MRKVYKIQFVLHTMGYDFRKDLESGLAVPVPIDILQPLQIGLCSESLERVRRLYENNSDEVWPIALWPLSDENKYIISDGSHTTYENHNKSKEKVVAKLHPLYLAKHNSSYLEKLEFFEEIRLQPTRIIRDETELIETNNETIIEEYEKTHERFISKMEFIRSKVRIYHVSDLEKNIFPTAKQLRKTDEILFNAWMREKG